MNDDEYYNRCYSTKMISFGDELSINKIAGDNCCDVTIVNCGSSSINKITIKNKRILQYMHFMLGELLKT